MGEDCNPAGSISSKPLYNLREIKFWVKNAEVNKIKEKMEFTAMKMQKDIREKYEKNRNIRNETLRWS